MPRNSAAAMIKRSENMRPSRGFRAGSGFLPSRSRTHVAFTVITKYIKSGTRNTDRYVQFAESHWTKKFTHHGRAPRTTAVETHVRKERGICDFISGFTPRLHWM